MQNVNSKPFMPQGNPDPTPRTSGWRWTSIGMLLCATLTLAACASLDTRKPEEQVRQRSTERWQALVKGEFSRAYTYYTPGFRAAITADGYRNRFGGAVTWVGAEVVAVNCPEASKCLATLRIDYKPSLSRQNSSTIATHLDETWLYENGQWWFFQKM